MMNYDKIKNMSLSEMSKFLCHGEHNTCETCGFKDYPARCGIEVAIHTMWLVSEDENEVKDDKNIQQTN